MCDCFNPSCHLCDRRLPLHIADFCTERENVEVYCAAHVGKTHQFPGSVWQWKEGDPLDGFRKGERMGILILDTKGLSDEHVDGIVPNTGEGDCIKKHPRRDGGRPVEEWPD